MNLLGLFKVLGRWAVRAFGIARQHGLNDDLVEQALELVTKADSQFSDNHVRREWVVAALIAAGVKESIARFAVEVAVQLFKRG